MTRAARLLPLAMALGVVACHRSGDARELALAVKASDSLILAFSDSAAGEAPKLSVRPSLDTHGKLDPCLDRVSGTGFTLVKAGLFDLALPADFEQIGAQRSARDAAKYGYAKYQWRGNDNSTVTVSGENPDDYQGWSGLLTGECMLDASGGALHIELANATRQIPDYVVHAVLTLFNRPALLFEAHTRSPERQAALLHSLHTLFVDPRWGVSP